MKAAPTVIPNAGNEESIGVTKVARLPIQIIAAGIEENGEFCKGECPIIVFRYQVEGGWIVGTAFGSMLAFAQSFVPDPDRKWTPFVDIGKRRITSALATDPTPTQPSANVLALRAILQNKLQQSKPVTLAVPTIEQRGAATSGTAEKDVVDPLSHLPPAIKEVVLTIGADSKAGKLVLATFAPRQPRESTKPQQTPKS